MQIDEEYFNNEEFKQKLRLFEDSVKSGHPIYLDDDDLTDIIDYYNMSHMDEKAEQAADCHHRLLQSHERGRQGHADS